MRKSFACTAILFAVLLSSCALHSTTTIKSNERFLLGNNPHRTFRVKLKNVSAGEIEIHRAPIGGGRHSGQTIQLGESVHVRVEKNTALVIINNTPTDAPVELVVRGDTGLSMGYTKN
ncbi:MAG: hypothetical protein ACK514_06150 [Bacteroidota bacterium]|jgi:hypothetical protein|nr:hypothetical protein [Cytophagales bacterium]MCE2958351.1 hypothetical protein [Flammeovirgaceae bacterium]MCZ8071453.1 hypothetical protein [Cytophagales bacterium]